MPRLPDRDGKRALAQAARAHQRAQAATVAFHRAVLDAHEAGCSTRAIAERVGMSHQRIHQILQAS
jgi:transcriptional regulator of aromatic amino acid metabolism